MTLTLYNTLTNCLESFEPLEQGKVTMYCCGITAYDYCHLGHARTCIIWDVVRRYLCWCGYEVKYVQNFTDIDDKILNRARREHSSMEAVAERFIQAYFEDMEQLNVQRADLYPRATHTLNGIQRLVSELEAKGYAYESGGDVYYAVRRFNVYGKLSGRKLEELQAGASGRVALDNPGAPQKRDPFDFALWKSAKTDEPSWESPWGQGRPGWHIECSAMVRDCFGDTIDMHMGGSDLIFPHHENEIAQSEAASGKPLANYWLHNGMVKVGGEKMSKSLGNFTTIRDLLDSVEPMAVRLFILQAHYRKPLDFTDEALAAATNGWETLQEGLLFGLRYGQQLGWGNNLANSSVDIANTYKKRFQQAVDNDLNFAEGLAILFELAKELRKAGNLLVHQAELGIPSETLQAQWQTLIELSQVMGLETKEHPPDETNLTLDEVTIESLIDQRTTARKAKDFTESDRIRDQLKAQGVLLIDQPGGVTTWHRGNPE